jgi:hypothetical protein
VSPNLKVGTHKRKNPLRRIELNGFPIKLGASIDSSYLTNKAKKVNQEIPDFEDEC